MADKTVSSSGDRKNKQLSSFFEVIIDPSNPQRVYLPGETLTGYVEIIGKDANIVDINLVGEFYEVIGNEEMCTILSCETYFLDVKGGGEGMSEVPFTLNLNPEAPSSVATPLGGIRYRVTASLMAKESAGVKAAEKSLYLTVISPVQIEEDKAGKRAHIEEQGLFGCCCGAIRADLEVTQAKLLCGTRAVINAMIVNTTSKTVSMTLLALVQKIIRKKDGKSKKYTVARTERGPIMPGKQQVWLAERFLIPPLPPTRSDSYFDISYRFQMIIQKSPTKVIKVRIPVTIGNVMGMELPISWSEPRKEN